jgi:hypothetical protein
MQIGNISGAYNENRLGTHRFQRADSGGISIESKRSPCHASTLEAMRTQAFSDVIAGYED